MESLPEEMSYNPITVPSGAAASPAVGATKGSFGPVFAVVSVIAVVAVAACVIGRLCGRRMSKPKSGKQERPPEFWADSSDTEKGFEVIKRLPAAPPAMKPISSIRASMHDVDDGSFEIKFATPKPAPPPPPGRHGAPPPMGRPYGSRFGYPQHAGKQQASIHMF